MTSWIRFVWPHGLAGRTILLLLASLLLFHLGSLWLHQRGLHGTVAELDEARIAERLISASRVIAGLALSERDQAAHALSDPGLNLGWNSKPLVTSEGVLSDPAREWRARLVDSVPDLAPARFATSTDRTAAPGIHVSLPLPDGTWVNAMVMGSSDLPGGLLGDGTLASTTVMAVGIVIASVLLVRWLTGPLSRLAQAADDIGRSHTVAIPQNGPKEVRRLARALDAMQSRIIHLVDDRTQALAAVSHDLRTPITRLRLRAGFLDDPDTQACIEADLDEMEAMITATLAYLQGEAESEPPQLTDVAVLLATLCHTAADAGGDVSYQGPAHLDVHCRPIALRRAVANLIGNAVQYADSAFVRLESERDAVRIAIEDSGPGIPAEELERVFEPFQRLEASRNRSTGGVGLGLTIARRAVGEHGGTLALNNRPGGGLRAVICLPRGEARSSPRARPNGNEPGGGAPDGERHA